MSSAHHLYMSSALLPMVSMGLNYLLLWQEFVIEWNLWQECWIVSFQDHVNDLRDNLCCWFSLHVKSGHCSPSHLHMYMSSAYYLSICVLCAYYLQWSLISSFLTDNANVIHTSSLVLFIYSIMENMSSAPLPDDVSSAPLPDDMSSAPLLDDVSSAPLPDDRSSALQRNMSYLFEVWEASNRSTRQLVWFIWLFDWLA